MFNTRVFCKNEGIKRDQKDTGNDSEKKSENEYELESLKMLTLKAKIKTIRKVSIKMKEMMMKGDVKINTNRTMKVYMI